jgi:hypothetical protein
MGHTKIDFSGKKNQPHDVINKDMTMEQYQN